MGRRSSRPLSRATKTNSINYSFTPGSRFFFHFRRHMANSKWDVDRVGYNHAQQEQLLQVPASFCGRYGPYLIFVFPCRDILVFFLIYSVRDSCSKYIYVYTYIYMDMGVYSDIKLSWLLTIILMCNSHISIIRMCNSQVSIILICNSHISIILRWIHRE